MTRGAAVMTGKPRSPEAPSWSDVGTRSQALRRTLEALVRQISEMTGPEIADPVTAAYTLDEELRKWRELLDSASGKVASAAAQQRERSGEFLEYLDERLRRELIKRGHEVFGDTSPLVVDGIVHVAVDKKKPLVTINSEAAQDLSIDALCELITARLAVLRKDTVSPKAFLNQLADAYETELRITGKSRGSQVPTLSLLPHVMIARQTPGFRSNPTTRAFKEYSRDQFRADLHELLRSGKLDNTDVKFRYASGSDTVGAVFMFVPALQRTAHLGRVWFESD
jgi:hypothetical protein